MALKDILIFFLVALVTVTFILAEDNYRPDPINNENTFEEDLEEALENEASLGFDPLTRYARSDNSLIELFFLSVIECNYTTVGFRSCSSCGTSLLCLPGNVGFQRNCTLIGLTCNNGHCSFRDDTECAIAAAADDD